MVHGIRRHEHLLVVHDVPSAQPVKSDVVGERFREEQRLRVDCVRIHKVFISFNNCIRTDRLIFEIGVCLRDLGKTSLY